MFSFPLSVLSALPKVVTVIRKTENIYHKLAGVAIVTGIKIFHLLKVNQGKEYLKKIKNLPKEKIILQFLRDMEHKTTSTSI